MSHTSLSCGGNKKLFINVEVNVVGLYGCGPDCHGNKNTMALRKSKADIRINQTNKKFTTLYSEATEHNCRGEEIPTLWQPDNETRSQRPTESLLK